MKVLKAKPADAETVRDQAKLARQASNVVKTEVRKLDRGMAQLVMTVR